ADGSMIFAARGISSSQWWRKGHSHIDETELWQKTDENYRELIPRGAKQMWPMPNADGSKLFYVSDRSGQQNIWVRERSGQPRQLTNFADGRVLWLNLSYDAAELVFEHNFRIWKMKADGGRPEELPVALRGAAAGPLTERVNLSTQLREFALSPDGKKVAVVARGEVFAASAKDGGEALRVTNTTAAESYVSWAADSRKLIYASERNGSMELFQYDFTTETESQITKGSNLDSSPIFSPDGKSVAFFRNSRQLIVYDTTSKQERKLADLYTDPAPLLGGRTLAWSPDSKWIAYLTYAPDSRSYTNVSVVPAAGGAAKPVSFLANSNSGTVVWSPDGSYILFDSSQRTENTVLARVDLKLRTPKFREDQFRDLFKQENPQDRRPTPAASPSPSPTPAPAASPSPEQKTDDKPTEIVFDDIRRRLSFIDTHVDGGNPVISPDGKTLVVLASQEGQFNLYSIAIDDLATDTSARQLTSTSGFKSDPQFSQDGKDVFYLENGRLNSVSLERRDSRPINLSIDLNVDFADERVEVFRQGWRYIRDNFYDDKYHGVDWNAVRGTYEPMIAAARNMDEVRRLMSLMVGELNASHSGVAGASGFTALQVGKLGLRFDRNAYETNGKLKISEVITLGPAAVTRSINVGDHLFSVDGTPVGAGRNLDELLENKVGKRIVLGIGSAADGSNKRDVVVKPISTGAEKNLLYRQWVEANRAYVAKISGGRIGYVHLPDMSSNTLSQLYVDLDAENQAKDGVVVDIRNNNGGFINPYVIDILSRRGYMTMRERGLWEVPSRSALGQRALERPTVLVTNQHSLSDAEDLTEGYRALRLGKVVGEPTAGWIIYTWNSGLFDGTTIRLPRQLILGADGKNMELSPRPVDVAVTRPIGETMTGRDSQLEQAVRLLTGSIAKRD
ncbi:MAG: S41 family peptidase, partial [Acidobacteriota bacterium]